METEEIIFKEILKRGYSLRGDVKIWNISDSKLWFLTPELSKGYINIKNSNIPYRKNILEPELFLLKENSKKIMGMLGKKSFNLIDLGCGTGNRTKEFISNIPEGAKIKYSPVNINSFFVNKSIEKISSMNNSKITGIKPFISDIAEIEDIIGVLRGGEHNPNLLLLLGSQVSHYEINSVLFDLSNAMFRGDVIVIGNGLRKGEKFVDLPKYKNPLFNEWFIYIMRGLGFKDEEVEYDARFENYRVEGFYRILKDRTVEYNGRKIQFKQGDEIVVAVQYKFYESELTDFCKMYFSNVEMIKNSDGEYSLIVCRK